MSNAKVTPAQILQTLIDGRALIAEPSGWTQRTSARDADGEGIDPISEGAVCFCTTGALLAVTPYTIPAAQVLWNAIKAITGENFGPVTYNDSHTHAEVLAVWDKAIEIAEAEVVVANLKSAKEVIASPEAWTKRTYARNKAGDEVEPCSEDATCFCAYGAVERVTGINYGKDKKCQTYVVLNEAGQQASGMPWPDSSAANFNDFRSTKHEQILGMFDAAIVLAETKVANLKTNQGA